MALTKCRECGEKVAKKAKACPHCGVDKPGRKEYSWKTMLIGSAFVVGFVVWASSADQPPRPATAGSSEPVAPPAASSIPERDRAAIDAWLTGWSTAQASSVRETCLAEPGCDADQYVPSARPETSFGWDGASRIAPTEDWAEGPRYHVTANGRTSLIYLRAGQVVGVDLIMDGGRRNICRDAGCRP